MRYGSVIAVVAGLVLSAVAAPAARASLLLDVTGGSPPDLITSSATLGYQFTLASPLNVAAPGIWDQDKHTLVESHQVGLWTSGGTLLASTTVSSASLPAPSAFSSGQWVFTNITPLSLPAGTYRIGAFYADLADTFLEFDVALSPGAGVTFGGEAVSGGSTFAFPDRVFPNSVGSFGPNISTVAVAPVAEPSGLLMLATGLLVLGWFRFRKPKFAGSARRGFRIAMAPASSQP